MLSNEHPKFWSFGCMKYLAVRTCWSWKRSDATTTQQRIQETHAATFPCRFIQQAFIQYNIIYQNPAAGEAGARYLFSSQRAPSGSEGLWRTGQRCRVDACTNGDIFHPSSPAALALALYFRSCLSFRIFFFLAFATLVGSSCQRPVDSMSSRSSLSHPSFVNTSAAICDVSRQWIEVEPSSGVCPRSGSPWSGRRGSSHPLVWELTSVLGDGGLKALGIREG